MPRKSPKPTDEITFETAFAELEAIVDKLEAGELPLDESLALFESGQVLVARCNKLLQEAELKIKMLAPGGDEQALEDFEPEDDE